MNVKYFPDTDTALIEFTSKPIAESREVSENVYLDLDADGRLVNMTIEHAKEHSAIKELTFEEVGTAR